MASAPGNVFGGGSLVYTGGDYIYAFQGGNSSAFWRYSISANSWTSMASAPDAVGGTSVDGELLTYTGGDYIYALQGDTINFWRYSISNNSWVSMTPTPLPVDDGAALVAVGDYIYAFRGRDTTDFWRYSVGDDTGYDKLASGGLMLRGNIFAEQGTNLVASTSNTALTVTQSGTGNIIELYDSSYKVFQVADGGELTLWRNATLSGANLTISPLSPPTGLSVSTSTSAGSCATSTTYYYRVTAVNPNGETIGSTEVSITTGDSDTAIDVSFDSVEGATGYKVYRHTSSISDGASVTLVDNTTKTTTSFTDDCSGDGTGTIPSSNTTGGNLAVNTNTLYVDAETGRVGIGTTAPSYKLQVSGMGSFDYIRYKKDVWTSMADTPAIVYGGGSQAVYTGEDYIYALRGKNTTDFWRYSISSNSWTSMASTPASVELGATMVYTGGDYIYAVGGGDTTDFWRYSISSNSWTSMASLPDICGLFYNCPLVYTGGDYIYGFIGSLDKVYKYSISSNTWTEVGEMPFDLAYSAAAVYTGGDYIFVVPGKYSVAFWRYSISSNSWTQMADLPQNPGCNGTSAVYTGGDYIYMIFGCSNTFARYSISQNTWKTLSSTPDNVSYGGSLIYTGDFMYVLQGGDKTGFWRYTPGYAPRYDKLASGGLMLRGNIVTDGQDFGIIGGNVGIGTTTPTAKLTVTQSGTGDIVNLYDGSNKVFQVADGGNITAWRNATLTGGNLTIGPLSPPSNLSVATSSSSGSCSTSTTYYYRVTAVNPNGETIGSTEVSITTGDSDTAIDVSFDSVEGATGYKVYRHTSSISDGSSVTLVDNTTKTTTSFTDDCSGDGTGTIPSSNTTGGNLAVNTNTLYVDAETGRVGIGTTAPSYKLQVSGMGSFDYIRYKKDVWTSMADAPAGVHLGGSLVYTGGDYIYAFRGNGSTDFWRYSISANSWTSMTSAPAPVYYGGSLVYTGGDYIYAFRGHSYNHFWRYSISANSWTSMTSAPGTVSRGASLVYTGGDYIYAFRGNSTDFWRYSISANSWTSMANAPGTVDYGGSLVYTGGDYIYAFRGNSTDFWRYTVGGDTGYDKLTSQGLMLRGNIVTDGQDFGIIGGNVGIGTATPTAKLTVTQSGTGDIVNLYDGSYKVFQVADGGNITAWRNATLSGGNLTIGPLSPPTGLSVATSSSSGSCATSTTYYYRVTAVNPNGETIGSTEVSITTGDSDTAIDVSFDSVEGATGYKVYRHTSSISDGSSVTLVDNTTKTTTSFTDDCLGDGTGTIPSKNTTGGNLEVEGNISLNGGKISPAAFPPK